MNLFKSWLELALACISLASLVWTGILYFKSKVEREFAAQRDFQHIKNNLKQFSDSVALLSKDLEDSNDEIRVELKEIKATVISLSMRFDAILSRFDANSGFYRRQD